MAERFYPIASPATRASSTWFPCLKPSARTRTKKFPTNNFSPSNNARFPDRVPAVECTANTMASAIEALGMSLPNSSAQNAISPAKMDDCRRAGAAVVEMLRRGIKPLDILTKPAFENAITVVIALGGSTNAVLHLLAIAHAAKVKLTIDDFTRIGKRVPVLADLKPSGKHLMSELVAIGGIRPLMKILLDKKLLHGDALTVTGETIAETLRDVKPYPAHQTIIQPFDQPIKKDSHLVIFRGNLGRA